MSLEDKQKLFNDLLQTVKNCSERGMYQSAKWFGDKWETNADGRAAEAMNSMDLEVVVATSGHLMSIDSSGDGIMVGQQSQVVLETQDLPKYLLGKSYFDCKEYDRAAFVLAGCQSFKSKFLRLYSKFLVINSSMFLSRIGWREKEGG